MGLTVGGGNCNVNFKLMLRACCLDTFPCTAGGVIPSELCSSTGIYVDVTDTEIYCYDGCLITSDVYIEGATNDCHDGWITERFAIAVSCAILLGIIAWPVYNSHWIDRSISEPVER